MQCSEGHFVRNWLEAERPIGYNIKEVRRQNTEDRKQKTEDRKQKMDDRGQTTDDGERRVK